MERLTGKESYCSYTYCDNQGKCKIENVCYDKKLYDKLKGFENLEEQLESIYGECDGLLETAVKSLVKHEGVDFGKPYKARLLTDEDVDKWEEHKDLEEQGRLIRLPCKVGDTVYRILDNIYEFEVTCIRLYEDKMLLDIENSDIGMGFSLDANRFGKNLFLTYEEAEKALAEMREQYEV